MGTITIDDSRAPVIVTTLEGDIDDVQFAAYLDETTERLRNPTRNIVIVDGSKRTTSMSASQRRMQAAWMKQHAAVLKATTQMTIFVVSSALDRGLLTAILWLTPMPTPHQVVRSMEQALAVAATLVGHQAA